jgi:hypothetical protein
MDQWATHSPHLPASPGRYHFLRTWLESHGIVHWDRRAGILGGILGSIGGVMGGLFGVLAGLGVSPQNPLFYAPLLLAIVGTVITLGWYTKNKRRDLNQLAERFGPQKSELLQLNAIVHSGRLEMHLGSKADLLEDAAREAVQVSAQLSSAPFASMPEGSPYLQVGRRVSRALDASMAELVRLALLPGPAEIDTMKETLQTMKAASTEFGQVAAALPRAESNADTSEDLRAALEELRILRDAHRELDGVADVAASDSETESFRIGPE